MPFAVCSSRASSSSTPRSAMAEASDGVQPRRDDEADATGGDRLALQPRRPNERRDADRRRLVQQLETVPREDPVLAAQWRNVGDRRQRDEVEHPEDEILVAAGGAHQRQRELEDHAGRAEVLVARRTARALRIEQGVRRGHLSRREMVVDDDDVDPRRPQRGNRGDGARAAVAGDDDGRAGRFRCLDARRGQVVAVDEPARNERHRARAQRLEGANQDCRRRHSIDVVIAVDEDGLAARGGGPQPLDGDVEVQQSAVLEMVQPRPEIPLRRVAGDVPSGCQQPAGHLGQAERLAQPGDYVGLRYVRNEPPGSGPGGNIERGHIRKLEMGDDTDKHHSPA